MFGGKELVSIHELNVYDFNARMQDPVIPRFTSMDPLCEKYPWMSGYAYCGNNPVNRIDLDGMQGVAVVKGSRYAAQPHKLKRIYRAIKSLFFGTAIGMESIAIYNHFVDGDRPEEVCDALTQGFSSEKSNTSNSQSEVESISIQASNNSDDGDNKEKKSNPKREAREKAKVERDNQPASEKYAKDKAKAKSKAERPDARRKIHDAKEKGAPDRSKKQIDEDYNINHKL